MCVGGSEGEIKIQLLVHSADGQARNSIWVHQMCQEKAGSEAEPARTETGGHTDATVMPQHWSWHKNFRSSNIKILLEL